MSHHDYGAKNHRERPTFKVTKLRAATLAPAQQEELLDLQFEFDTENGRRWAALQGIRCGASAQEVAHALERAAATIRQCMLDYARAR